MKKLLALSLPLFVAHASCLNSAAASPVYKWIDENGTAHFSSTPQHASAVKADLPPIMREKFTIDQVKKTTCAEHGGVSCQSGTDQDGSVICHDGFKDAVARYRFACSEPKLEIADVSAARADGSFSVYVRNLAGIEAKGAKVVLRSVEGKEIVGKGPIGIPALGMEEYKFYTSLQAGQKAAKSNFKVACENCMAG